MCIRDRYYRGGEYDYLLNSDEQLDLLNKRFVGFEIDEIKEHKILFSVVTVIIMEAVSYTHLDVYKRQARYWWVRMA